ncbi:MAG: thiamine pyrophosphate-binding protein [Bryobacteraceae bacterium]
MIRLADYVVRSLADWGVRRIFLVTGGGAMHLNDAIAREQRIGYICHHHEQAAAMAAEGYARIAGTPGVVNVTTGPGGINALNGVFGAWTDSVPMLVISGQVKRETCRSSLKIDGLRQLGDQEADIVGMVQGITKYAVLINDPRTIRYHLERAWHLAASGRPGPCWLDIPIDVQASMIDESTLEAYDPAQDDVLWNKDRIASQCTQIVQRIRRSERPVILAGTGVRAAGALKEFERVANLLRIPVTTAWTHDLIPTADELFCGRPGTIGDRAGNFTVQNSDTLLVLGSRLNIRQVSYNWKAFARHAFRIQVDIDAAELAKPTVRAELPVHCDLKVFLTELARQLRECGYTPAHSEWLKWSKALQGKYPVVLLKHRRPGPRVNPYHFAEHLSAALDSDDVVVCGDATACIVTFQTARIRQGQRLFSNSGSASMGHDLPAAIGAAVAREGKRVVCLAGDGSMQFNIQELQTIKHHQLPVKIFVLNNNGYLSIRTTQSTFFKKMIGESPESGVSFPDFVRVAAAYGIPSCRIETAGDLGSIQGLLDAPGPMLCEVMIDPAQEFEPRLKSRQLADGTMVSPALEDMYPFLDRDELAGNLLFEEEPALAGRGD